MNNVSYNLIQKANVVVSVVPGIKFNRTHITVNDQFEHTFEETSRLSQALYSSSPEQLQSRLSGGSYFFVNDALIDCRDNQYNGFVHSEEAIEQLMQTIGIETNVATTRRNNLRLNTTVSPITLTKKWSEDAFQVPGYLAGGAFSSAITFGWNPYMQYVRGAFEIIREICTNGMVGTSDLINCRIPLINRWEEHLNIADIQMQNMVQSFVARRLSEMGHERATVSELQLITNHARARLENASVLFDNKAAQRLIEIIRAVDPKYHLTGHYNEQVFNNSNVAARMPGHLSLFDTWNAVTEIHSHTTECADSTGGGLQRLANKMVFPSKDDKKGLLIERTPMISAFSDPDRAFFGDC